MDRIAGRFARVEPRRRIRHLVLGLLADLPRKYCWTIAEWADEATPDAVQHPLSRAKWDADAIRDDLRPAAAVQNPRGRSTLCRASAEWAVGRVGGHLGWELPPGRCR